MKLNILIGGNHMWAYWVYFDKKKLNKAILNG